MGLDIGRSELTYWQQKYIPTIQANTQVSFVVLSDVWLDHPRTLPALRKLFEGYADAVEYKPMVFVLCGNFCQRGWEGEDGLKRYTSMSPSTPFPCFEELPDTVKHLADPRRRLQRSYRPSHIIPSPPFLPFRLCSRPA